MSKQIKRAADLPDWFETSKYAGAVRLDARGWYEQLSIRSICHEIVEFRDVSGELDDLPDYDLEPVEFLSAVRTNPLFSFSGGKFQQFVEDEMGADHPMQYQAAYPPGILGVTPYDIRRIVREWEPDLQKEFLDWLRPENAHSPTSPTYKRPPRPIRNWAFRPLKSKNITPVTINPIFPDKVLHTSLNVFVSKQRDLVEPEVLLKDKRSTIFDKWCDCGLLQYLDLQIWSSQENRSITNKALASGICPSYEMGEENIRTTTKKHASMILGGAKPVITMTTLWAYARLEDFLDSQ